MSTSTAMPKRVLLSFPTLITLATTNADATARAESWIQLAVVGEFVSNKYGKFEISKEDLSDMVRNFAADRTPIDYDHMTDSPTHPGDGIAAGWLQRVELRDAGTTLWGWVEWTHDAEKRIANREYRYISPSFMKDYTTPTGEKIGTKLLAAALTNVPFLPEMAAVVLGNKDVFGSFALSLPTGTPHTTGAVSLAELGQRVTFVDDAERTPELSDEERRQTFLVKALIGEGEDQFVRLATPDGWEAGWFRVTQLAAAHPEANTAETKTMHDVKTTETDIEKKAAAFLRRLPQGYTATDVVNLSRQYPDEGEAYRLVGVGVVAVEDEPVPAPINLSERSGESFDEKVKRYSLERGVPLRQAVRDVGAAYPSLAAAR